MIAMLVQETAAITSDIPPGLTTLLALASSGGLTSSPLLGLPSTTEEGFFSRNMSISCCIKVF